MTANAGSAAVALSVSIGMRVGCCNFKVVVHLLSALIADAVTVNIV